MRNAITANRDKRVFYIGKKRPKVESTFGTKLRFMPGQSHVMLASIADNLLRFPDVFTAEGSLELDAFIKANPLDAAKQGLVELGDAELATLQQAAADDEAKRLEAEKQAKEDAESDGMLIPANGGDGAVNEAEADEHLDLMKAEIENLLTKAAIQDWVTAKGIDATLTGTKPDFVNQAFALYEDHYNAGN